MIAVEPYRYWMGARPTSTAISALQTSPMMCRRVLDHLIVPRADVIGYSMGRRRRRDAVCDPPSGQSAKGGRHFVHALRRDGGVKGKRSMRYRNSRTSKALPIEVEYKKLSPTPNEFPNCLSTSSRRQRNRTTSMLISLAGLGADVFHPWRCRRHTARPHRRNVPLEGRRDYGRHAAALRIEIGHIAPDDTRHPDAAAWTSSS